MKKQLSKVKLAYAPAGPNAFRRMIGSAGAATAGEIVAVYDKNDRPYGVGLYNPRSQIALRIFTRENPDIFDLEGFIKRQVSRAVSFRKDVLKLDKVTNACRLVHDYGDGLPGLVVDRYGDNIVLEFYSFAMYRLAPLLEAAFREHFPKAVFPHRARSYTETMEGFKLPAAQPAMSSVGGKLMAVSPAKKARVSENGVLFEVDMAGGHKTGFFCDQRDNRLYASSLAEGRSVLDICSYTGGFGIYAMKLGGAKDVTCVELDPEAVELSKRNANITMETDGTLMRLSKENFNALLKEPMLNWLSLDEAKERVAKGAKLLDVRLESEHSNNGIPGSLNIPLFMLRLKTDSLNPDVPYIVYCDTGRRSSAAAFLLGERGFETYVLQGGLMEQTPGAA